MPDQHGPQRTGEFVVEFDDDKVAGWKTVTIPSVSIEQGTYREGNEAPQEKAVAGQPTYDDLEMEREVTVGDTTVWEWVNNIRQGKVEGSQQDITITAQDADGNTLMQWEFTDCLPHSYQPPRLDASADSEAGTEHLSVSIDQMKEVPIKTLCGKQVPPLIDDYNQAAEDVPPLVDELIAGETIHFIVEGDETRDYTVETDSDNRVKSFQDQKPADPTIEVKTNCQIVDKLTNTTEPGAAAKKAYQNGEITIRGKNPAKGAIIGAIEILYNIGRSLNLL